MKKFVKLSSLFCALVIGFCASAFADVLVWNQVNVPNEQKLAKEREKQGALIGSLNHALKCIAYGSQPGSWLEIETVKPLVGPWKVRYSCKEYEQAMMENNRAILNLFK